MCTGSRRGRLALLMLAGAAALFPASLRGEPLGPVSPAPPPWVVFLRRTPGAGPAARRAAAVAGRAGVRRERVFRSAAAFVVRAGVDGVIRLLRDPQVAAVVPDLPVRGLLAGSVPQIRADRVHRRGIEGAPVAVAVLDTGIRGDHPDLAGARVAEACFCRTGCCPDGAAEMVGPGAARTDSDHGPHVAGIVASRGVLAPQGVAPAADLIAVRVLDDARMGFLSDVAAALEWLSAGDLPAADLRRRLRVVNLSLGTTRDAAGLFREPCDGAGGEHALLAGLVAALRARGVVTFAASGNDGDPSAVVSPACLSGVAAVGAVGPRDEVAAFSNGGPLLTLVAPGENIVSDGAAGVRVLSGTSMAAAHASGAAALLFSALPGLPASMALQILADTGEPVVDPRNGRLERRVDALRALRTAGELSPVVLGGGSRAADCLLTWEVPTAGGVRQHPRAVVRCRDGDPGCDGDVVEGQCTFFVAPCFQLPSSLLPDCGVSGVLERFRLLAPSPGAPAGSVERENAEALLRSLPLFPVGTSSLCAQATAFRVPRPEGGRGIAAVRAVVEARDGRRDADVVRFVCE